MSIIHTGVQQAIPYWFDPVDMERTWNGSSLIWKAEVVSHNAVDLRNREGSNESRNQFWQSDSLSRGILWCGELTPISTLMVVGLGLGLPLGASTIMQTWTDGLLACRSYSGESVGWYHLEHWKGMKPVAKLGRGLCAYSTQMRCLDQGEGLPEAR